MFETIDRLDSEIINVQLLDKYFVNGKVRLDNEFMRQDYIFEMSRNNIKSLIKEYEKQGTLNNVNDFSEDDEYTLDDILEVLVADLDIYALIYNVPEVRINDNDWDLLFDVMADYYIANDLCDDFMDDMITLNKMVIAKALVYDDDCIDIASYIGSLKYLESERLPISNIIGMVNKLTDAFGKDLLDKVTNPDGSYGCIGKDLELLIIDTLDDSSIELDNEKLIEYLGVLGYKVNDTLEIATDEVVKDNKVVDFTKYKSRKGK